jgi:hypothetical protein
VSQCQINDKWKKYMEEWNDGMMEHWNIGLKKTIFAFKHYSIIPELSLLDFEL